jgi:hypothetical protein
MNHLQCTPARWSNQCGYGGGCAMDGVQGDLDPSSFNEVGFYKDLCHRLDAHRNSLKGIEMRSRSVLRESLCADRAEVWSSQAAFSRAYGVPLWQVSEGQANGILSGRENHQTNVRVGTKGSVKVGSSESSCAQQWIVDGSQAAKKRESAATSVSGLTHAGHWTPLLSKQFARDVPPRQTTQFYGYGPSLEHTADSKHVSFAAPTPLAETKQVGTMTFSNSTLLSGRSGSSILTSCSSNILTGSSTSSKSYRTEAERIEDQKRLHAAKHIQKHVRGRQSRKRVLRMRREALQRDLRLSVGMPKKYNYLRLEESIGIDSHVVAKLRGAWIRAPYVYSKVVKMEPFTISNSHGTTYDGKDLEWAVLAQDDGWLAPFDQDWQESGRYVLLQLMNQEWVSATVAPNHRVQPIHEGLLHLDLQGIDGLTSVCIQTDVAYLFTPHCDCIEEFGHAHPSRGGRLADHIADAFENPQPLQGEKVDDALRRQRRRWVEVSRHDGQYPLRSVWVHPQIKEGALNQFAQRAYHRKQDCPTHIDPEIVVLMGPPAAGKSSISRLKPEQLEGSLKPLRKTANSLKYREEVNNDNLTDCMPGFAHEYKYALSTDRSHQRKGKRLWQRSFSKIKSEKKKDSALRVASKLDWMKEARQAELTSESWALQWLTYLVYHHGPVRDSLALDIIKVTIVDARELPVFYSSCMAGKAMGRAMLILELSHSDMDPIPHKALPFRGFWPYTSQEARFDRQAGRADEEKKEGKLKGGNLTSNLVDIHYHAQQAETNITKMLECLQKGVKPSDEDDSEEETDVIVDHFLVIDNEGKEPKILMDFGVDDKDAEENIHKRLMSAVSDVISWRDLHEKKWDAFDPHLFRICYFFLKTYAHPEHPLLARATKLIELNGVAGIPNEPEKVLPLVVELDEEVFRRLYGKRSTATDTDEYRRVEDIGDDARAVLAELSDEDVHRLKNDISVLRKNTVLTIMQFIKNEGSMEDALIDAEATISS